MLHSIWTYLVGFWHYFYVPKTGPWYGGNVWGNMFVVVVAAPLAWIWSKTRYWPLGLIHQKLDHLREQHSSLHDKMDDLHRKHDELHAKHNALLDKLDQGV